MSKTSIFLYGILAAAVAGIALTLSIWLPNLNFVFDLLFTLDATIGERLSLLLSLYGGLATNFTFVSASYTVLIALLLGINVSLLVFLIRQRQKASIGGVTTTGIGGFISGIFGIGCAACGTFVLSSLLGLFGASWLLTRLPFGGEEFGILGVALLGYTTYALYKKIKEPLVCEV